MHLLFLCSEWNLQKFQQNACFEKCCEFLLAIVSLSLPNLNKSARTVCPKDLFDKSCMYLPLFPFVYVIFCSFRYIVHLLDLRKVTSTLCEFVSLLSPVDTFSNSNVPVVRSAPCCPDEDNVFNTEDMWTVLSQLHLTCNFYIEVILSHFPHSLSLNLGILPFTQPTRSLPSGPDRVCRWMYFICWAHFKFSLFGRLWIALCIFMLVMVHALVKLCSCSCNFTSWGSLSHLQKAHTQPALSSHSACLPASILSDLLL